MCPYKKISLYENITSNAFKKKSHLYPASLMVEFTGADALSVLYNKDWTCQLPKKIQFNLKPEKNVNLICIEEINR